MMTNYKDHAANERTWLAWLRTSLAIGTFGFFIEKFEMFLALHTPAKETALHLRVAPLIPYVGLAMIAISIVIMIITTGRFFITSHRIDADSLQLPPGRWVIVLVSVLLTSIFVMLFVCMAAQIF